MSFNFFSDDIVYNSYCTVLIPFQSILIVFISLIFCCIVNCCLIDSPFIRFVNATCKFLNQFKFL